jgi:hypothetical protein
MPHPYSALIILIPRGFSIDEEALIVTFVVIVNV